MLDRKEWWSEGFSFYHDQIGFSRQVTLLSLLLQKKRVDSTTLLFVEFETFCYKAKRNTYYNTTAVLGIRWKSNATLFRPITTFDDTFVWTNLLLFIDVLFEFKKLIYSLQHNSCLRIHWEPIVVLFGPIPDDTFCFENL